MKHTILAAILFLVPFAAAADQCDSMVYLFEVAMDLRLDGKAVSTAAQFGWDAMDDDTPQTAYDRWSYIVIKTYEMPSEWLTGADRADMLSQVYLACIGD